MSIYDPLSEFLGIEPNVKLYQRIFNTTEFEDIPSQYNSLICSEEAIKRNTNIVCCDRCGIFGGETNMMRWHFENCKTTLKKCKECDNIIPRQNIKDFLYDKKIYCNRKCYMKSKKGIPPIVMTKEVKEKLSKKAKFHSKERSHRMTNNKVWEKSGRWKTK